MLRFKRITTVIMLVIAMTILFGNYVLGNPVLLKTVVSISGKVIDKTDDSPIGTKIFIYNDKYEIVGVFKSSDIDGTFFLTGLKPGKVYFLSLETTKDNFNKIRILTPKVIEYTEIVRDLLIDNDNKIVEVLSIK
ncbi:MAG: hypothetical protein V1779_09675 [bacterium]